MSLKGATLKALSHENQTADHWASDKENLLNRKTLSYNFHYENGFKFVFKTSLNAFMNSLMHC